MNETIHIGIILLFLYITYLYFSWICVRHYAKTVLSESNLNDVICFIVDGDK